MLIRTYMCTASAAGAVILSAGDEDPTVLLVLLVLPRLVLLLLVLVLLVLLLLVLPMLVLTHSLSP